MPIPHNDAACRSGRAASARACSAASPAPSLLASAADWHALLDQHPDGLIVSLDACIQYANPAAAALLAVDAPPALIGRSVFHFLPADTHQLFQQHRFLVECGEIPPPLEVPYPDPRSRLRLRSTPAKINGRYAMQTVLQDISRQHQREAALRQAKEHAETMNQLKSRFLAQMSHEIRTPLTSIVGFAEILNENDLGTWNEFAGYIERSSRRLLRTINSVLDLSRLEAGALELEPTRINVSAAIRETAELFHHRAARHDIQLDINVPHPALHGVFDAKALDRILDNLISNAIKFTSEGGRVAVRADEVDGELQIDVEDTGVGIAPQFLPQLFDAFKQGAAQAHDDEPGSGLGLAITHQLVELMDGTIDVESETGVGTRFTVRLPRQTA